MKKNRNDRNRSISKKSKLDQSLVFCCQQPDKILKSVQIVLHTDMYICPFSSTYISFIYPIYIYLSVYLSIDLSVYLST